MSSNSAIFCSSSGKGRLEPSHLRGLSVLVERYHSGMLQFAVTVELGRCRPARYSAL
jgi:hypothetical protein